MMAVITKHMVKICTSFQCLACNEAISPKKEANPMTITKDITTSANELYMMCVFKGYLLE